MPFGLFGEEDEDENLPVEEPFQITDPKVREFISNKYSPEARQKLVDQNMKESEGPNWGGALSALAAGFGGGDPLEAGQNYNKSKSASREKRLTDFDSQRKLALEEEDIVKKRERQAAEMDPNSDDSKLAQQMAIEMGVNPELAGRLTAAQLKEKLPFIEKKFSADQARILRKDTEEQRRLDRGEAREDRRLAQGLRQDALEEKRDEKMQALKTPYGLANSIDDAKQLKEAHESKQNFDSKLAEMIDLRKKYGAESFNREAVARGKQLSKDLLLEYKNMAKLGVLSKADEDIINAIIPDDPLAFTSSSLVGQDPILSNLEKFRKDNENDFKNRVATRTREGIQNYAANPPGAGGDEAARKRQARIAELRAKGGKNSGVAR